MPSSSVPAISTAAGDVFFDVREQVGDDLRESVGVEQARRGEVAAGVNIEAVASNEGAKCASTAVTTLAGTQARGWRGRSPRSWREKVSTLSIKRPRRRASSCTSARRRVVSCGESSLDFRGEIDVEENVGQRRAQLVGDAIDERDALRGQRERAPLLAKHREAKQRRESAEQAGPASVGA